mmetsp:Transcript_10781/g.22864  ORF Transcript_10781/g.22864 Transcript_10781/m.22864 type:complete len:101 (-) Transcript_10781:71-373(-)|eukprot:CAMPEP_0182843630 /NCGR_PEP_ID=MMETSP0006_2-20121128/26297_1 /TAXON_ID=97485 /ORGANISM="Prymnesium parvum, Strain Texoma1" /LENGTH=100 /DNA_ID=CAMNT_0024973449 /DNA_START=503 /DNA_END=805 /DNA_ORIENTATION=-
MKTKYRTGSSRQNRQGLKLSRRIGRHGKQAPFVFGLMEHLDRLGGFRWRGEGGSTEPLRSSIRTLRDIGTNNVSCCFEKMLEILPSRLPCQVAYMYLATS